MTDAGQPAPRKWGRVRNMSHSPGSYDAGLPVAAFDFDSTLQPFRGSGPPMEITLTLLARLSPSFNLVIVSNRSKDTAAALDPIRDYVADLDARTGGDNGRVTVYAAHARDRDRKPHTGAWEHFVETACRGDAPRFAFYCGDAAGRPGDHAASDLMFAINCGIQFVAPDALFGGGGAPWADPWVAPPLPAAIKGGPRSMKDMLISAIRNRGAPLIVIMVGSPASGKTSLAGALVARGFTHISRDMQGPSHYNKFADAARRGENIVVDNTNPTEGDRGVYACVKTRLTQYEILYCHVETPKDACFHLSAARCQNGGRELAPVVLHTYWKRFEMPTDEEVAKSDGHLVRIPFVLSDAAPDTVTRFRYV